MFPFRNLVNFVGDRFVYRYPKYCASVLRMRNVKGMLDVHVGPIFHSGLDTHHSG